MKPDTVIIKRNILNDNVLCLNKPHIPYRRHFPFQHFPKALYRLIVLRNSRTKNTFPKARFFNQLCCFFRSKLSCANRMLIRMLGKTGFLLYSILKASWTIFPLIYKAIAHPTIRFVSTSIIAHTYSFLPAILNSLISEHRSLLSTVTENLSLIRFCLIIFFACTSFCCTAFFYFSLYLLWLLTRIFSIYR